jgi:hypothetical protein
MAVYLVDGYIFDEMGNIPITLGVFSKRSIAERAIIHFIGSATCTLKNGKYHVLDMKRDMTYCLGITKNKLDRIIRPSYFQ